MAAALIAAVTLPQFLLGLGDRNIWIPLEARYALVAREMLETGQWILPHLAVAGLCRQAATAVLVYRVSSQPSDRV